MKSQILKSLEEHASRVGLDTNLVQASGGNVSWKDKEEILIKASGKRLCDANSENIFCRINHQTLSRNEIIETEDFSRHVQGVLSPSIETNFHLLVPQPYVTHIHSLGSIALGLIQNSNKKVSSYLASKEIISIPYVRPGVALARVIAAVQSVKSNVLLLNNHGIIFSGDTTNQIELLIQDFENESRAILASLPLFETLPDWRQILTGGVLTPDEAVFLGREPFINSEHRSLNSVSINSFGDLIFPKNFSEDRIEMACFYARLAKAVEKKAKVEYLQTSEVDALLSWEREIRRIEMAD